MLRSGGNSGREHVVLESANKLEISVRSKRWVYRRLLEAGLSSIDHLAPTRFYDLSKDPTEHIHRVDHAEGAAASILKQFSEIADTFLRQQESWARAEYRHPEHIEALRELGYIE